MGLCFGDDWGWMVFVLDFMCKGYHYHYSHANTKKKTNFTLHVHGLYFDVEVGWAFEGLGHRHKQHPPPPFIFEIGYLKYDDFYCDSVRQNPI